MQAPVPAPDNIHPPQGRESARQSQRLDKWLWYARVIKTRSLAQKLIRGGNVRVDAKRITQVSFALNVGMVLTITYANRVLILRARAPGTRRGPASEAQLLYEDLSPVPEKKEKAQDRAGMGGREPGSGRPTKKQRRQTDQLLGRKDATG